MTRAPTLAFAFAVAACGYTPPAAPPGSPDASGIPIIPPTPTPPDGVSVTVTVAGSAVVGAPVYFQNADSTIVLASETDPTGTVGAALADGGFVTVVLRAASDGTTSDAVDQLFTFAGVQARDQLHVDLRPPVPGHGVQYQTGLAGLAAGAASYAVYSACSDEPAFLDASGTGTVVLDSCGSGADLVVVAQGADGVAVSAETVVDQTLVDPGPNPIGSAYPVEPLQLPGQFAALVATSIAVQNAPTAFASVGGTVGVLDPSGRTLFETTNIAPVSAGTATVGMLSPAPVAAGELTLVTADFQPGGLAVGEQVVQVWGPAAASYTVDAGSAVLAEYTAVPSLAGSAVAWAEAGGTPADLVRVGLQLSRSGVPQGRTWSWHVIGARGTTSALPLPTIPFDGRFDYNPATTDAAVFAELTSARVPGGYDAIRAHGFAPLAAAVAAQPVTAGTATIETVFVPSL